MVKNNRCFRDNLAGNIMDISVDMMRHDDVIAISIFLDGANGDG